MNVMKVENMSKTELSTSFIKYYKLIILPNLV